MPGGARSFRQPRRRFPRLRRRLHVNNTVEFGLGCRLDAAPGGLGLLTSSGKFSRRRGLPVLHQQSRRHVITDDDAGRWRIGGETGIWKDARLQQGIEPEGEQAEHERVGRKMDAHRHAYAVAFLFDDAPSWGRKRRAPPLVPVLSIGREKLSALADDYSNATEAKTNLRGQVSSRLSNGPNGKADFRRMPRSYLIFGDIEGKLPRAPCRMH